MRNYNLAAASRLKLAFLFMYTTIFEHYKCEEPSQLQSSHKLEEFVNDNVRSCSKVQTSSQLLSFKMCGRDPNKHIIVANGKKHRKRKNSAVSLTKKRIK